MQCARNADTRHRIHNQIRVIGKLDGYAEPFPGFACGKAAHTAGDLGFRVEHQHVSAAVRERRKAIVMQGASHGDHGDLDVIAGELRCCEQAIAAVVTGSGEDNHIGVLERDRLAAQHAFRLMRCSCRRHTHQRHAVVQQRPLQFAYRVCGVHVELEHLQTFVIDASTHGMAPFLSMAFRPAAPGTRTAISTLVPPWAVQHPTPRTG